MSHVNALRLTLDVLYNNEQSHSKITSTILSFLSVLNHLEIKYSSQVRVPLDPHMSGAFHSQMHKV